MRSPCRVSQGSTCSMVSEWGAMSALSPPVATTVEGPSSSMKRRANPSTWAANPYSVPDSIDSTVERPMT
jgi:hypothetical protein